MSPLVIVCAGIGLVPLAMLGYATGYQSLDDRGCALQETTQADHSNSSLVRIRIENEGRGQGVRLCVFEDRAEERFDEKVLLPERGTHEFDVRLSAQAQRVSLELDRPGWEWEAYSVIGAGGELPDCNRGIPEFAFTSRYYSNGSAILGPRMRCVEPTTSTMAQPFSLWGTIGPRAPGGFVGSNVVGAMLGVGATIGVLAVAAHYRQTLKILAFGLFTRLTHARLLDHEIRARILAAVHADPGIHASALCRRLALSRGATEYHLAVLTRENLVACFAGEGFRRYFPWGKYSAKEMRRSAALRHERADELYALVRSSPGLASTDVARRLGMSAARVSSLVRKFCREGLLSRSRDGRFVRLFATIPETGPGESQT